MCVADLFLNLPDELPLQIAQIVVACRTADLIEIIADDRRAVRGRFHLGMELHTVELSLRILHGGVGTIGGVRGGGESRRQSRHLIRVAHQPDLIRIQTSE